MLIQGGGSAFFKALICQNTPQTPLPIHFLTLWLDISQHQPPQVGPVGQVGQSKDAVSHDGLKFRRTWSETTAFLSDDDGHGVSAARVSGSSSWVAVAVTYPGTCWTCFVVQASGNWCGFGWRFSLFASLSSYVVRGDPWLTSRGKVSRLVKVVEMVQSVSVQHGGLIKSQAASMVTNTDDNAAVSFPKVTEEEEEAEPPVCLRGHTDCCFWASVSQ